MSKKKKLTKSNDRILGGVLGGISDYLNLDTTLVRLLFAAATVFSGFFPFIFLYIIAIIIMPEAPTETHHTTYQFDEKSNGQRRDVTPDDDDKEDDEL